MLYIVIWKYFLYSASGMHFFKKEIIFPISKEITKLKSITFQQNLLKTMLWNPREISLAQCHWIVMFKLLLQRVKMTNIPLASKGAFCPLWHNPVAGSRKDVVFTFHVIRYHPRITAIEENGQAGGADKFTFVEIDNWELPHRRSSFQKTLQANALRLLSCKVAFSRWEYFRANIIWNLSHGWWIHYMWHIMCKGFLDSSFN